MAVFFGIFYRLRNIFYSDYLLCLMCNKVCNRSCARIKIINQLATSKLSKRTCYTIKMIGLIGVCLIKAFRTNLKLQVLHRLIDEVGALKGCKFQITKGVISFLIVNINQARDLRKGICNVLK